MTVRSLRSYEKELRETDRKARKSIFDLQPCEKEITEAVTQTTAYFEIYDATEHTNCDKVFFESFLNPKNDGRTIIALANDFGWCPRSYLTHKKREMEVYIFILERMKVQEKLHFRG